MTDRYLKLPLSFDIQRLQSDLSILKAREWHAHINQRAHNGGWCALPLRSVDGCTWNITVTETDQTHYTDTAFLAECSYLPAVLSQLQCPLLSARLMSLEAGDEIRRHTDNALSFQDGYVRLHIPVQTHPDVIFTIDDHPVHFAAGECWYMNADLPHAVRNNSPVDRIHLVVDCEVNDWLSDLFMQAGFKNEPVTHKYGDPSINDDNVLAIAAQLEAMGTDTDLQMAAQLRDIHQR